jgi:uncharacterized membrane protein
MPKKITYIVLALFVVLSIGLSLALTNSFPEQMASHWNEAGQVDGYSSKFMGLYFMPLIQLLVAAVIIGIPSLDPLRRNIESFRGTYHLFAVAIVGFLTYMHILTLVWNLGYQMNMVLWMIPAFALLFFLAGSLIGKAKQNYSIGIRTPWTLANTVVWEDTHRVGGVVFKGCALISLVGMLFPDVAFFFMIGPILVGALGLVVYSYVRFAQIERNTH